MSRILIVQGHPDSSSSHFCRALASAYAEGAAAEGHDVSTLDVASLNLPPLRSRAEWESASAPASVGEAQHAFQRAEHLVFIFPLWLGTLPSLLKAFFEQVLRPGFAFDEAKGPFSARLTGRSSRIIVTMGMPGWVYRWWFRARGIRSFEQGILRFVGVRPNRTTLIGSIELMSNERRQRWLDRIRDLGQQCR